MKKVKKSTSGITLIALVITVAILAILTGLSIYSGKETIQEAKLEELKTNMLLIQAKSKEYVEKANFRMGINPDEKTTTEKQQIRNEVYGTANEEGAQLQKANSSEIPSQFGISDASTCYWLTAETQSKWGLEKIELDTAKNELYLIQFNEKDETVEVYNTLGFEGKYSLTEINKLEI